jgi:hypothetical protein
MRFAVPSLVSTSAAVKGFLKRFNGGIGAGGGDVSVKQGVLREVLEN